MVEGSNFLWKFPFAEKAPAAVVSVIGRKEYEHCAKDLYFFIQVVLFTRICICLSFSFSNAHSRSASTVAVQMPLNRNISFVELFCSQLSA